MSPISQQYVKRYLKSNYRLLILIIVIQILVFQNMLSLINLIVEFLFGSFGGNAQFHLTALFECICFMAFLTPLYQFRYLMKRSSCDLYLSLPIKRKEFFQIQFLIGVLFIIGTTMISLCGSYLLSNTLVYLVEYIVQIIIIEVLGISLYALFTWIIVKCNTFFDSIMVSVAYTILPMLIILTIYIFINRIIDSILLSSSYGGLGGVMDSDVLLVFANFLSLPWAMLSFVEYGILPNEVNAYTLIVSALYWILLGIVLYFLGQKAYVSRKGEQSGECTKTWMTYPVSIPLFTMCLIMITKVSLNTIFNLVFIFLIYLAMYFFAKRKMKITTLMVFQFMCLLFVATGVERILITNNFFDRVQEVYEISDISEERIEIGIEDKRYESEVEHNISNVKRYKSHDIVEDDEKQAVHEFHKQLLSYCEKKKYLYDRNKEGTAIYIYFTLQLDSPTLIQRNYTIKSEEGKAFVMEAISSLTKSGILVEVGNNNE